MHLIFLHFKDLHNKHFLTIKYTDSLAANFQVNVLVGY